MKFITHLRSVQFIFIFLLTLVSFTTCWADTQEETTELIEQSVELINVEMATPRFEGFRNLIGASRAVLILPNYKQGAFWFGYGRGRGIVLKRFGKNWSDPLFVTISDINLGFQFGFFQSRTVAFVLTDKTVTKLEESVAHWGTAGGAAFLKWGVDASGTASWDSGLDSTIAGLSKGLYFGGAFNRTNVSPYDEFNQHFYDNKTAPSILATPGTHPKAAELRNILHVMIEEVWEN